MQILLAPGNIFTTEGLKVDLSKTAAINDMPVPTDVTSQQCFLPQLPQQLHLKSQ